MKKEKHKSSDRSFIKNGSMKNILYFIVVVTLFSSCMEGSRGELTGVYGRPLWYQVDPYGMLYIPAGSFNMGQSDQDVPMAHYSRTKTVSQGAFYMDQTEISNNEYRQFVVWVRDSIARRKLGAEFPDEFLIPTYDFSFSGRAPPRARIRKKCCPQCTVLKVGTVAGTALAHWIHVLPV